MNLLSAFFASSITGWSFGGLIVLSVVFMLLRGTLIPRKFHEEVRDQWKDSSAKWEGVATEALAQNTNLIESQGISKKFYTELLAKDPQLGDSLGARGGD